MERLGYLIVPRNRQGMIEQMEGSDSSENLLFVPLTPDEVATLLPLLEEFERAFGFDSRGARAEQLIDTRYAGRALDLTWTHHATAASPVAQSAARKVAQSLDAALEYGSFVEFAL